MSSQTGQGDPMKEMAAQLAPLATLTATYYKQLVAEGVPRPDALKLAESLIGQFMRSAMAQSERSRPPIPPTISFLGPDTAA